jgi:hypothetical protein
MPSTAVVPAKKSVLHPGTGALILAVDWLFFGAEAITLGGAVFLTSILAFTITAIGVFWIQTTKGGDSVPLAATKAFLSGVVAGIPTSIGGTVLGSVILALSGLKHWSARVTDRHD